jgi:hypothetical protein
MFHDVRAYEAVGTGDAKFQICFSHGPSLTSRPREALSCGAYLANPVGHRPLDQQHPATKK